METWASYRPDFHRLVHGGAVDLSTEEGAGRNGGVGCGQQAGDNQKEQGDVRFHEVLPETWDFSGA